jgi:hypothetical protein
MHTFEHGLGVCVSLRLCGRACSPVHISPERCFAYDTKAPEAYTKGKVGALSLPAMLAELGIRIMQRHFCFQPPSPSLNPPAQSSRPCAADPCSRAPSAALAPPAVSRDPSASALEYLRARSTLKNRIGGTHSTAVTAITAAVATCQEGVARSMTRQEQPRVRACTRGRCRHAKLEAGRGGGTCSSHSSGGHGNSLRGYARVAARRLRGRSCCTILRPLRACLDVRIPEGEEQLEE